MFYPDWQNINNLIVTVIIVFSSTAIIMKEYFPNSRMGYSKFNKKSSNNILSFYGMLIIYVPSFIVSSYILCFQSNNNHMLRVSVMVFLHYLKRVYEVIFVHKYSGDTNLIDSLCISSGYVGYAVILTIFARKVPLINIWSECIGIGLFILGECINSYHHDILRRLRKDGSKEYKIPQGGLFRYVWCPHYIGEIITFIAMVFMTQHFLVLLLQIGSAAYLAVRAYNTKAWYKTKFKNIPQRACLLPGIF